MKWGNSSIDDLHWVLNKIYEASLSKDLMFLFHLLTAGSRPGATLRTPEFGLQSLHPLIVHSLCTGKTGAVGFCSLTRQ